MNKKVNQDLRLKIGNLLLAIWLSTVPTVITFGVFSLHGLNICRNLTNKTQKELVLEVKGNCEKATFETTKSYIFLIGFFITLPTWMWFYLSMKKKASHSNKLED